MLRIIAGEFRSRKLLQPPLTITRPAKDRVREGIFSSLGTMVKGALVLDLFAGSGAYGLEAMSRGAVYAHFNDHQREAVKTIQTNLNTLGITSALVTQFDFKKKLEQCVEKKLIFDLIFLDPPYQDQQTLTLAIDLIQRDHLLQRGGYLVLEADYPSGNLLPNSYAIKQYNYGRTHITIGKRIS